MQGKLIVIRTIGYGNLAALIYGLFGLKDYGVFAVGLALPPAIAIAGTVFYFTRWSKTFPNVSEREARTAMSPYLMGTSISVLALVLIYGLAAYAEFHK